MTWCTNGGISTQILVAYLPVNNTSVLRYWKIPFYPPNTDTGTFYGSSTDIDTDAQYPEFITQARLWACGRGDVSTPSFGSHPNPISTRHSVLN